MTAGRPFTDKVIELNRRLRYSDMATRCNDARSSAWFNNLRNGKAVGPPSRDFAPDIGELFGVSPQRVCEMIAEEWYGVRADTDVSTRARSLSATLDLLSDDDFAMVEAIVNRLAK